jgi:hypothetical protein
MAAVEDYIPMCISLAGKYRLREEAAMFTPDSESYAEALLAAHTAISGYDPEMGMDLAGFVHLCVSRKLRHFRRTRDTRQREEAVTSLSVVEVDLIDPSSVPPVETDMLAEVEKARNLLPSHLTGIYDEYYNAMRLCESQSQTSVRLGVHRQSWSRSVLTMKEVFSNGIKAGRHLVR